jgi:hypothetical protein
MNHSRTTSTRTSQPASSSRATGTSSATPTAAASSLCGCGCSNPVETANCCKLTCFERPKYFCGQLLSDADLTLEETYFREKNKLYHRALDGFGVVCGLQMRCDGNCKGFITVGDGYAIDCCGNDLVICEPRTFDVIGELRKKNWLIDTGRGPCHDRLSERKKQDEANDRQHDGGCITKQCFYIGICYAEEPSDFVAPYTTDCSPAPGPCQPSRIRETVRFEIYDELPVRPNPLDQIAKRIECCFRLFREGQFSRGLQSLAPRILEILCSDNQREEIDDRAYHLFQELQAQFLHQLRTCPDQYNCCLEEEVYRLRPPARGDQALRTPPLEAFTTLLELIQKYVFSCVLAQFAFPCLEPPDACCVLIGSVEIENGRLTRVINYPRWYLWCFANFFEVLTYQLANDAACGKKKTLKTAGDPKQAPKEGKTGCCPGFEVDVCEFLNLFSVENRAFEKAARTSVDAIQEMYLALVEGFNFTRPGGVASSVFRNLSVENATNISKAFGLDFLPLAGQEPAGSDMIASLTNTRMIFPHQGLVYNSAEEKVTQVNPIVGAPAFAVGPYTYQDIADLKESVKRLQAEVAALTTERDKYQPPPAPAEGDHDGHN